MAAKENLNSLKMLVFSLGLILIGAMVLLAGIVYKKMGADATANQAPAVADCPGADINLKGHGMLIDTGFDDRIMRVTMQKTEGQSEIMLIDICTGKILTTTTLETDAAVME